MNGSTTLFLATCFTGVGTTEGDAILDDVSRAVSLELTKTPVTTATLIRPRPATAQTALMEREPPHRQFQNVVRRSGQEQGKYHEPEIYDPCECHTGPNVRGKNENRPVP